MTEWRTAKLSELAADEPSSISKPYGSAIYKDDYTAEGIPVVRGVNLARGIFYDDDFVFISPTLAAKMPGAQLKAGDLVFAHRGTVGQVSMVPRSPRHQRYVASTSQVKVRLDPKQALSEFYYYWFISEKGQQSILENISTVGVPGLVQPVATVKRLTVPVPPIREQLAIAEILGALDDKIAANAQLAVTAHELASTLFRQAVGYAEYSGQTFGDLATVGGGGTPSTKQPDFWEGTIRWATPTDVTSLAGPYLEDTGRKITPVGLAACASSLYPVGTILMTSRATIGAFALAQVPTSVNQGFITVQPADESLRYWFYHEMRDRVDEFIAMANGATFLELSRRNFKKFEVRLADQHVMSAFCHKAEPLHGAARHALAENCVLAATRDALLPQVMSGKLAIKEARSTVDQLV